MINHTLHSFKEQNDEYIRLSLEYSIQAAEESIASAQINKDEITDLIFVSTTGLSTPSLDALIIKKMRLNQNISRIPVFGLGCAGGVSGFSKASTLAIANPDAIVLLVAVELCSFTFLDTQSKLYYDSLDVMGWEFLEYQNLSYS